MKNNFEENIREDDDHSQTPEVQNRKTIEEIYLGRAEADYPRGKSFAQKFFIFVVLLITTAGLAALGYWGYSNFIKKADVAVKPSIINANDIIKNSSPAPIEKKEAEEKLSEGDGVASPAPADIKIAVLNGGSPAGSAGKLQTVLKSLGYQKTEAGNARGSIYNGKIVYYLPDFKAAAEGVAEKIKNTYPTVTVKEAASAEEKAASIVIILGN